jgi:hypothetical protein
VSLADEDSAGSSPSSEPFIVLALAAKTALPLHVVGNERAVRVTTIPIVAGSGAGQRADVSL